MIKVGSRVRVKTREELKRDRLLYDWAEEPSKTMGKIGLISDVKPLSLFPYIINFFDKSVHSLFGYAENEIICLSDDFDLE